MDPFNQGVSGQVIWVDEDAVQLCKQIHFGDPWAVQCSRTIESHLFKLGIEVFKGTTRVRMSEEFQHIFDTFWVPFAYKALVEYMTRGIVPIVIKNMEGIDPIPVVVCGPGRIRQIYDRKTESYIYEYYRLDDKDRAFSTSMLSQKPDKNVIIIADLGVGAAPDEWGKLRSPLSSLLKTKRFMSKVDEYVLKAEVAKAEPWYITAVSERHYDQFDHVRGFGNDTQEQLNQNHQSRMYGMSSELEIANRGREIYDQNYKDMWNSNNYFGNTNLSDLNKPPKFWPMPPGQTLSQAAFPPARNDWKIMKEQTENEISAAYGVPKSIIAGEGRVLASVKSNEKNFHQTLSAWRKIITDIFNRVYHIIYDKEEVAEQLTKDKNEEALAPIAKEKVLLKDLKQKIFESRIKFRFPEETYTDFEDLALQYAYKTITWPEFQIQSRKMIGVFNLNDETQNKDPWSSEQKYSFIVGSGKSQQEGETKKPSKEKEKKKKKTTDSKEGESSNEPKKKKQKTTSDDNKKE